MIEDGGEEAYMIEVPFFFSFSDFFMTVLKKATTLYLNFRVPILNYSFFFFRCLYDYVDVFFIDMARMKHHNKRVCGTNIPKPIISVHQRVELVFKSDYAGSHKGFEGKFEFIDEREFKACMPAYVRRNKGKGVGVGGYA